MNADESSVIAFYGAFPIQANGVLGEYSWYFRDRWGVASVEFSKDGKTVFCFKGKGDLYLSCESDDFDAEIDVEACTRFVRTAIAAFLISRS